MKRTEFVLLALAALMCCQVTAQDTIDGRLRVENYFYPQYWPWKNIQNATVGVTIPLSSNGEFGLLYETTDTLTIYGIAAAIRDGSETHTCLDTSYANSFEFLRIYESIHASGSDTLRCIDQVKVHLHTTPIAYYANFNRINPTSPVGIWPMYEQYFNAPIVAVDSFYIGMTMYIPMSSGTQTIFACPPLLLGSTAATHDYRMIVHMPDNAYIPGWTTGSAPSFLLFPILTPDSSVVPNDTVIVGDTNIVSSDTVIVGDTLIITDSIAVWDTLVVNDTTITCDTLYSSDTSVICDTMVSIDTIVTLDTIVRVDTVLLNDTILVIPERGLLGRMVGLMPNPATATAKVVSSFGVSTIEVFSMAGEHMLTLRLPDTPLSATLDVKALPRGSYIVRIHTPMGITSRKLILQ
jgi:hypothetical protein